jgi:hypothetical protein
MNIVEHRHLVSRKVGRAALLAAALVALVIASVPAAAVTSEQRNSYFAHACHKDGYKYLFGIEGQTFKNPGECTNYAANGGNFAGFVLPPGRTATFSDAYFNACNELAWGYTVDSTSLQTGTGPQLGYKPYGCDSHLDSPIPAGSEVAGPFSHTVLLRIWLTDITCGGATFYFAGGVPHVAIQGTNGVSPWFVHLTDAGGFCEGATSARPPVPPTEGNLNVKVTLS